jgi:hypothetical protein
MEASQRSGVLVVNKLANHRHGGEGGWWGAPTTTSGASGGCLISAHHERRRNHKGWKDGAAGITDQRLDSGKGDRRTEIRRRRREVRDVGACGYFSFHFTRWSVGRARCLGYFARNDVRLSYASGSPDLKHFGTAKDVAAAAAKRASPSTDGETSHPRYPAFSPDRPCMWIVEKPTIPLFVAVFPANR